jgi:LPS-assembly lipoprotein
MGADMITISRLTCSRLTFYAATLAVALSLTGCQFQPMYSSSSGTIGSSGSALSSVSVNEVDTREAQQVRNHLVFLLSGGTTPVNPAHVVTLRVASNVLTSAAAITNGTTSQLGNTTGSVRITASYEILDTVKKEIVARGTRETFASFDKTSQSFASSRAQRDAENRAAKEVAEQLRLAISSDLSKV